MKTLGRWQVATRDLVTLTAFVACALALSRISFVWAALDAHNIGKPAAVVLYVGFWTGLILVDLLARAPDRRFFGFGCVFVAVLVAPVLLPQTNLGMEPDWPAFGKTFLISGAASMFLVAGLIRRIARR